MTIGGVFVGFPNEKVPYGSYLPRVSEILKESRSFFIDFAVNHYGKPDVAMFDFTSMYAADHSAR